MSLYDDLLPTVRELMAEFKQGRITVVRTVTSPPPADWPTWEPWDGNRTTSVYELDAVARGVSARLIDGQVVRVGDLQVTCSDQMTLVEVNGLAVPRQSVAFDVRLLDTLAIDGVPMSIVLDQSSPAAGVRLAYKYIVRGLAGAANIAPPPVIIDLTQSAEAIVEAGNPSLLIAIAEAAEALGETGSAAVILNAVAEAEAIATSGAAALVLNVDQAAEAIAVDPDTPEVVSPEVPVFPAYTSHAWDPMGGADQDGAIPAAVGLSPLWAMDAQGVIPDWNGLLARQQALILDADDAGPALEGGPCTLTFWRRLSTGSTGFRDIVSYANAPINNAAAVQGSWRLTNFDTADLEYVYRAADGFQHGGVGNGVIIADQWQFLAITINGDAWTAYVDGVEVVAATIFQADASGVERALCFGPQQPLGSAVDHETPFAIQNGVEQRLGDIRIHNRHLTAAEIADMYADGRQSY